MKEYIPQIIATGLVILFYPSTRLILSKIIKRYARISGKSARINHMLRIIYTFLNLICVTAIVIIWGVDPRNIFVAMSSIFAVIGVAMFAQWSILSNITAGIIIFFTSPFKIGDFIMIHDKDIPIEAEIEDILTFHTHLRTKEGEIIVYPNNLFLQKGVSVIQSKDIPKH